MNAGEIEAPGFYENRYAYLRARFIFGGRGWADPVKEAQAAGLRIEMGISTLEKECAEQGDDYEEIMDQRAIELRMASDRGLSTAQPIAVALASAGQDKSDDEQPGASQGQNEETAA